jgi:hypothetical protein
LEGDVLGKGVLVWLDELVVRLDLVEVVLLGTVELVIWIWEVLWRYVFSYWDVRMIIGW